MKSKCQVYKNGWSVFFDKLGVSGMYLVEVRTSAGEIHDKVRCDEYRLAQDFYRTFRNIARNA